MKLIIRFWYVIGTFLILAAVITGTSRAMTTLNANTFTLTLVSAAKNGEQGNHFSGLQSISGDGRYVAFVSHSSNLIANDTNDVNDIFVKDNLTGDVTRVSVASDGTESNRESWHPTSISSDGRFVAFLSTASNLVVGDTNSCPYYTHVGECPDIFVHDTQTGTTERVSVASDGAQSNDGSYYPNISANGRYVVFDSYGTNLVPYDTNGVGDVFVHDLATGQTSLVSLSSNGEQGNGSSFKAYISGDGRYIGFVSYASNFESNDTNNTYDVFLHDMQTGETNCISLAPDGSIGNGGSSNVSMSYDGRYIVFESNASNLVATDSNNASDIFIFDRLTNLTSLVSVAQDGSQANSYSFFPFISANGRYVSFDSDANNLVSGDTNNLVDIFVHDLFTNQIDRVSIASDGSQSNASCNCEQSVMSATGQFIAFSSPATNLVSGDTNEQDDIFLYTVLQANIASNYSTGNPGSYFNLTGTNFPANQMANVSVNGHLLGTMQIGASGAFTFTLTTSTAEEGYYYVTASANPSATVKFVLDNDYETRTQEGNYLLLNVPAGVAFTNEIYLPLVQR